MNVFRVPRYREALTTRRTRSLYFIAFLLVATVTLGSLVYASVLLWVEPYAGLRWNVQSGLVYKVDRTSPSARAGIQSGDRILLVNGVPPLKGYPVYRNKQQDLTITLTFARSNHIYRVPVQLAPPPWWVRVRRLVPLLVALAFWGTSLSVWIFHYEHSVTRVFFLTSQISAALLAVGAMTTVYTAYVSWSITAFRLLLIAVAPVVLHFFTLFPHQISSTLRRRLLIPTYGVAFLLALMTWLVDRESPLSVQPYWALNRIYVVLVFAVALFVAFRRWEDASVQALRYRRLLAMSMGLSITPLLMLSFIPEIVQGTPLVDYTWTFLFLMVIPMTYAHALWAGELGTVDWVLSRTLAHLVLSGIFIIIYLFLFLWMENIVPFARRMSPLAVAGLAVMAAALFTPTRRYLLHFADRFLYGGWYDYRATLQELSQKLRGIIRVEDLADLLVHRLSEALRLRGAVLLLATGEQFVPVQTVGIFARALPRPFTTNGCVTGTLVCMNRPMTPAQIQQALVGADMTPEERAWVYLPDVALWLPLLHGQKLEGVLLLGKRISGDPLESEDLRLLDILAAHAATAAENIRLVESLRARVEEVKQLYAQLAQAREEERKHLARELHDVVLQDVINAYVTLDRVITGPNGNDQEQLRWVHEQILRTIQALRRLCTELRPPALDITDLRSAIEGLVEDVRRESGLEISLTFPEGGYQALDGLPDAVSITLYRVLQEILANVRRHARAKHVHVRVHKQSGWIGLEVEDDGQGFVVPPRLSLFVRERHYGLAGLEERVQGVGGRLKVQSAPGRGTLVRVHLPLQVD